MSNISLQFIDNNGVTTSIVLNIESWRMTNDDDVIIFVNQEQYDARLALNVWFDHPEKRNMMLTFSNCNDLYKICFGCTPSVKGELCYKIHFNSSTFTNEEDYVGAVRNHFRSHFIRVLNKVIDNLNFM